MEKIIKWILWLAVIGIIVLLGWRYVVAKNASASTIQHHNKIWICHVPKEGKSISLYVDEHGWNGHDHHKDDYKGKCKVEPTPTLTPTPTEEPTETPTETPTPTPTEEVKEVVQNHDGPVAAPVCKDDGVKYAPTVTKMWRDGKGNVDMTWTTTDTKDFVVYYGLSGKELNWNTGRITGQSITLHNTPNVLLDGIVCSVSPCGAEKCSVRFIDP